MSIFDDIRKDREAAKTHGFHWIGETHMAKEYDEVIDLCHVDWSGLDECEAEHKRRIARAPRLERIALAANRLELVADCVSTKLDSPEQGVSFDLARDLRNALTAFRAACEADQ